MSRIFIANLPPGTSIRNIDDFCSPFGRLLYVDVKNEGNSTLACVEFESSRNAYNLLRARDGYNLNGYIIQLKVMSGDSGPFEGGNDSRRNELSPAPPPPPAWSDNYVSSEERLNNNSYNNGQSPTFDCNRGNNYFPHSNRGSGSSSMDAGNINLDFNQACRIVYERFTREGYNPQVAKERAIEFVTNMQSSNNQGFNNSNSDYFGQSRGMDSDNNVGNNFDNFNGNQNWNDDYTGNQQTFPPNSSWGNYNQQMSYWGGDGGRGGSSGMPYPQQQWNNGGNYGNIVNDTVPRGDQPGPSVSHESYMKSAKIRRLIEAKMAKGISSPRDLKNLQFHTHIMEDYERNDRRRRQHTQNEPTKDEMEKLQRYKSALGIVQKYKKLDPSQLSPEDRKFLTRNKIIVDEYEKSVALSASSKRSNSTKNSQTAYERRKEELLKKAKKSYPYHFNLSGAARKKMRSLVFAGIPANESHFLALHTNVVVQELIDLKKGLKKTELARGLEKSKALFPVRSNTKLPVGAKGRAAKSIHSDTFDDGGKNLTKTERNGLRSAHRRVSSYEKRNVRIDELTDKDIALLRIALRRLKAQGEKHARKSIYNVLLSKKYDIRESQAFEKKEGADVK